MALTSKIESVITIMPDGQISIREDTIIDRDGIQISRLHHRRILDPALNPDITQESPLVLKLVEIIWTPEVKKARIEAFQKAAKLQL